MNAWEWVTAVLAIWGAVSIMAGVFWGLAGRRIFRPRPTQPKQDDGVVFTGDFETDRRQLDRYRGGER